MQINKTDKGRGKHKHRIIHVSNAAGQQLHKQEQKPDNGTPFQYPTYWVLLFPLLTLKFFGV